MMIQYITIGVLIGVSWARNSRWVSKGKKGKINLGTVPTLYDPEISNLLVQAPGTHEEANKILNEILPLFKNETIKTDFVHFIANAPLREKVNFLNSRYYMLPPADTRMANVTTDALCERTCEQVCRIVCNGASGGHDEKDCHNVCHTVCACVLNGQ